jgi:hypothetical protein
MMADILKGNERPLPISTLREIPAHLDWRTHTAAYDDLLEEVASTERAVRAV